MNKYRLVIAEKPSVGMTIAAVLGANMRQEGYLEGNGYIVSWCFGHLAELARAEAYDDAYTKWRCDQLPIVPDVWRVTVARDKRKQYDILNTLMHREDVGEIINACDAGREGELIFCYVYDRTGCRKPMLRLWLSSLEDEAIRRGFSDLRPGSGYVNLYHAALCRAKADWLVGINATRLFSVLYHRTLNVGRVVSPTLALIVQRDAEIRAFQPEPYYTVRMDFPKFSASSERFKTRVDADGLAAACSGKDAVVKAVVRKEKSEKAPALYDLTALQRDANRMLGFTAQQTLDYLQALYEKKLVSYPRTDSRYLTDDMALTVKATVLCAAGICDMPAPFAVQYEQVCNSRKVSDHHAIIPTMNAGEIDLSMLSAGEREILRLVARQVLMAVSEPYQFAETDITLDCAGVEFTAKGKSVLAPGWRAYQPQQDKPIPDLWEEEFLTPDGITVTEGKTKAPAAYTEDTLLHAMEIAGAKDAPEDAERKRLGTPATRAATLEKLISAGFVERRKNQKTVSLVPIQAGISLITVLPEQLQSPLLTAQWEHKLKRIEHGDMEPEVFLAEITAMLRDLVQTYTVIPGAEVLFPSGRVVLGKCPRCGGDVTESKKGFFCERNDCRFALWRDNKYLAAKHINLRRSDVEALLRDGRVPMKNIYSEKTGGTFDANLLMEDNGERTVYRLGFDRG